MRQLSKEFIRDVQRVIGYDYIVGLIGLATQTVAGLMSAADKVKVDNLATTYAPIVHTHDDRYYTETEADAQLALKLNSSAYTAADVLAKLVTVDGVGSGLDADLLDGQSSAYYAVDSTVVKYTSQSKTSAEQGQARANIGFTTGDRSAIINGDFDIWQRGDSQTTNGYGSVDRWAVSLAGGSVTHSRQTFTLGQTDVPGDPKHFSRTVVTHAVGAGNYHLNYQSIEGVRTYNGQTATITIHAKADASRPVAIELVQYFGSGGSPSANVSTFVAKPTLTTAWSKQSFAVAVPSITGKTIGTNGDDFIQVLIWFEGGSTWNSRTGTLGQQSGTFDLAHISFVLGDATAEADPYPKRRFGVEELLCHRYYVRYNTLYGSGVCYTTTLALITMTLPTTMRAPPTVAFGGNFTVVSGGVDISPTSMGAGVIGFSVIRLSATVASGLTVGQGAVLQNSSGSYVEATAEI